MNRRQHQLWEQMALTELRNGNVAVAITAYRDHDRVVVAPDHKAMIAAAVVRWMTATDSGSRPVLLAGTNNVVEQLNLVVREQLKDYPRDSHSDLVALGGHLGTWNRKDVAVGERIVLRINDYQQPTPLLNGHTATVMSACADGVRARLDHNDTTVSLSGEYLGRGGFDYAYALTAHRAQGGTWDLAIAVGADGLYREAGYLTMSRGRDENWLVLTQTESDTISADLERHDSALHLPGEEPSGEGQRLVDLLCSSRAKTLAVTMDPYAELISNLADRVDLRTLEGLAANARGAEHEAVAVVGRTPATITADAERAIRTGTHIAIGQIVKPVDRRNLGTVQAIGDGDGTADVTFTAANGRMAEKTFRWDQLDIIEPRQPKPRSLNAVAELALQRIVAGHTDSVDRFNRLLAGNNVHPDDATIYATAVRLHIDRDAQTIKAERPEWLIETIGDRPVTPAGAQVWDDTVNEIAAYRSRHHVTQAPTVIGPRLETSSAEWDATMNAIIDAQTWLSAEGGRELPTLRQRTPAELAERGHELDQTLDNAPAVLDADRDTWIHDHWPQIVEQAQVAKALEAPAVDDLWYDGLGL